MLDPGQRAQHAGDVARQMLVGEPGRDVGDRPAEVALDQAEDLGDRRGEALDAQLAVEKDRGDLGVLQQVLLIAQRAVEALDLGVELGVHRLQFLVDRLQLLLGSLELLVRALQLLGDGLELLVRGFHLLVRGLELLDGCLQPLPGRH